MKKILSVLLLVFVLTTVLVSCELIDNSNTSDKGNAQGQDTTTPKGMVFEEGSNLYTEGLLFGTVRDEEGYVIVGYEGPAKDVVIPKVYRGFSVVGISDKAFADISKLESVSIPESVRYIGNSAFSGCVNIKCIEIPDSVTSIGVSAFYGCSSLRSITLPNGVASIGDFAFWGCSSLTSIMIPKGVMQIGDAVFYGCSSLTSVVISGNVKSIGASAFYGCRSLTHIVIPKSVTSIGDSAFFGCDSIECVYYEGTLFEWRRINISSGNIYLQAAAEYYYSENKPAKDSYMYWHYVDGVPTPW